MTAIIKSTDSIYPARVRARLGGHAPKQLYAFGNMALLAQPKTALFSSSRCPGDAILRTYDQAASWREARRCVVSGFHSPVEKECLRILLRGNGPIIVCPARGMPSRMPPEWIKPLADGRMLILSIFPPSVLRKTAALAAERNDFVAALADDIWIAHVTPGGKLDKLKKYGDKSGASTHP